jgi:hypothetical protein
MYYLNIEFSVLCGVVLGKNRKVTGHLGELAIDWSILKRILVGQVFCWPRAGLAFVSMTLNLELCESVDELSNCKRFHDIFRGVSVFVCGFFSLLYSINHYYGDSLITDLVRAAFYNSPHITVTVYHLKCLR